MQNLGNKVTNAALTETTDIIYMAFQNQDIIFIVVRHDSSFILVA